MQDYRKLYVWQRAHQFVLTVYAATKDFPSVEEYGLTSQVRRSAISLAANIAEGCGRGSNAELHRLLYQALGSASQCDYELLLAHDLHYLKSDLYSSMERELTEIRRMLNTLIQKTDKSDKASD